MSTYDMGDLPFARGTTFFGSGTVDSTSGAHLEGRKYKCKDRSSGKEVVLQVVRNAAPFVLNSKRIVQYSNDANYGKRVDGYTRLTAQDFAGVVDPLYGTKNIAINDLFYIVIEGAVTALTDLAGGANNLLPAGTVIVALTAVTSGATTAGRMGVQDLTGATQLLADQVQNAIGRAVTARTTANTNTETLFEIGRGPV